MALRALKVLGLEVLGNGGTLRGGTDSILKPRNNQEERIRHNGSACCSQIAGLCEVVERFSISPRNEDRSTPTCLTPVMKETN